MERERGEGIAPLGIVRIERERARREKREKDAFVLMAPGWGRETGNATC